MSEAEPKLLPLPAKESSLAESSRSIWALSSAQNLGWLVLVNGTPVHVCVHECIHRYSEKRNMALLMKESKHFAD